MCVCVCIVLVRVLVIYYNIKETFTAKVLISQIRPPWNYMNTTVQGTEFDSMVHI